MSDLNLKEADKLEVVVLVDNYTDALLESTSVAVRAPMRLPMTPLSEHGMACLLKVFSGPEEHHVLFDSGHGAECITFNMDYMELDAKKIETIVISHGHVDHIEGLTTVLQRTGKHVPVILHPNVFLEHRLNVKPINHIVDMPILNKEKLEKEIKLVISEEPSTIASDLVLVTNTVERVTDFEKGFPFCEIKINGEWVTDPFEDDQALAVKIKGKGLVVVGGCSHAGIINTIKYCQKLSGTEKIHAVMGGFHLNDKIFEPIIKPTIEEMKKLEPEYIVPMHCTGWKAMNDFEKEMPGQFILNSTCTTYQF